MARELVLSERTIIGTRRGIENVLENHRARGTLATPIDQLHARFVRTEAGQSRRAVTVQLWEPATVTRWGRVRRWCGDHPTAAHLMGISATALVISGAVLALLMGIVYAVGALIDGLMTAALAYGGSAVALLVGAVLALWLIRSAAGGHVCRGIVSHCDGCPR